MLHFYPSYLSRLEEFDPSTSTLEEFDPSTSTSSGKWGSYYGRIFLSWFVCEEITLHFSAILMGAGKNKSKHAAPVLLLRNIETFAVPDITHIL
jgi:hypothetical protein